MQNFKGTWPLFGVLFLALTSCCTKKNCLSWENLVAIQFEGFSPQEIDTIQFRAFEPGTSTLVSSYTYLDRAQRASTSSQLVLLGEAPLPSRYDYEVTLAGSTYRLGAIETTRQLCNDCGLFSADPYQALQRYELDGTPKTGSQVHIIR
ncbi:hypothetical protein GCM10027275_35330 [Rhabdobacter roseus]|uniref:Lipoprotein n=1 Tax=Rhabdobacter roseus TaxID=1655419 RepID=A0A840TQQ5_9BACT|nr:hypothetical protein [Rhabdobacter roseus]MBB5285245.1 hypothetical protein [Rhabdobacter roseus]